MALSKRKKAEKLIKEAYTYTKDDETIYNLLQIHYMGEYEIDEQHTESFLCVCLDKEDQDLVIFIDDVIFDDDGSMFLDTETIPINTEIITKIKDLNIESLKLLYAKE